MIINKPYIEIRNESTFLISMIKDDITNVEKEFFFSVSNNYGKYLCDEIADAFVVAMLIPALMSGQDIKVKAPVSEMLFYRLENSLIFVLSKVFNKKSINIFPDSTVNIDFNPKAVGTGFSGGVDSFTTVIQHTSEKHQEGMRLTHLTLFNVGAYGNDELVTEKNFDKDALRAKKFADYADMPLVLLNSNISKAYEVKEITHGFSPRSVICNMAGVLSLQKLFRIYLYASSYTIDNIKLDKWSQAYYESLLAYFLSAFNTKIIITNDNINRVEKIKLIAGNEKFQKFLFVCAADYLNEKSVVKFFKDTKPNCSECTKCLRTLIVLDVLGCLDKYTDSFDLQRYALQKNSYIKYMLSDTYRNDFFKEIYEFMIETNYQFPSEVRRHYIVRRFKDRVSVLSTKALRFGYFRILKPQIGLLKRNGLRIFSSRHKKIEKFRITGSKF